MRLDCSNGQTKTAEGMAYGSGRGQRGRALEMVRPNPWSQLVGAGRKDRLARPQGAKLGHLEER